MLGSRIDQISRLLQGGHHNRLRNEWQTTAIQHLQSWLSQLRRSRKKRKHFLCWICALAKQAGGRTGGRAGERTDAPAGGQDRGKAGRVGGRIDGQASVRAGEKTRRRTAGRSLRKLGRACALIAVLKRCFLQERICVMLYYALRTAVIKRAYPSHKTPLL